MILDIAKGLLKKITTINFRYKVINILETQKRNFQRKRIINTYMNSTDKEYREIIEYLKINKLDMYNYGFTKNYDKIKTKITYDNECEMFYVYHNNKKMYFSKAFDTKEKVESYYIFNCLEQDKESPHRYIFDENKIYKCVLDLGVAEGNFALDIIDNAEELYLFESEPGWVEALKHTFAPYKEKVHIIEKYVSNKTNELEIRLDDFFKDIQKEIDYIKVDIEGAEIIALQGMSKIIKDKNNSLEINICAYHAENHEREIRKILTDFNISCKRYIMPIWDKEANLRRGVLYCKRKAKV